MQINLSTLGFLNNFQIIGALARKPMDATVFALKHPDNTAIKQISLSLDFMDFLAEWSNLM